MRRRSPADWMKMHPSRGCASWADRWRLQFVDGETGLRGWLTLLCLGLVLLCGAIQAEHVHPADPGNIDGHAACSLCATAHVGVAAAVAPSLQVAASVVEQAEPRLVEPLCLSTLPFDLYTRPPPVALILA